MENLYKKRYADNLEFWLYVYCIYLYIYIFIYIYIYIYIIQIFIHTYIHCHLTDLYGLLVFLGVEPYWVRFWWNKILYEPYRHGNRDALEKVITEVLWRTAKKDVLEQVCHCRVCVGVCVCVSVRSARSTSN